MSSLQTPCEKTASTLVNRLLGDGRSISVLDHRLQRLLLQSTDAKVITNALGPYQKATLSIFSAEKIHMGNVSLDMEEDDSLYGENDHNDPTIEAIMVDVFN